MNEFGVPASYIWMIAALSGALFGVIAFRSGHSVPGYGILAFISTLCLAGIIFGLAHSIAVPYTASKNSSLSVYAFIATVLIVLLSAAAVWRWGLRVRN